MIWLPAIASSYGDRRARREQAIDIRHLRYFLAIVEEGSFTRAAARLNVAQPSLSLHVRNMEAELETPLLLRRPSGVVPTEAGEILARRARTLASDLEQALEEVRSAGAEPSGTVRLGLPGTVSGILAVPLITACRDRYPKIRIVIAEAMSGFVRDWLLAGEIDLAVIYADPLEVGVSWEALLKEELVILLAAQVDASALEPLDALRLHPLILPSASHGLRILLDRELSRAGIGVTPAIEVDSYVNIKRLVQDGHGCSVLPFHAVAAEVEAGDLQLLRFVEPRLIRKAQLAWRDVRPLTHATELVRDLLKETVTDLIETGRWPGAQKAQS